MKLPIPHYLIHRGAQSHTAFRDRENMLQWLEDRGLELTAELPEHKTFGTQKLTGSYADVSHRSYDAVLGIDDEYERVCALREGRPVPIRTRMLSNGAYTLGLITETPDGNRVVNYLNPNCQHRPTFDYTESRKMYG